MADIQRAHEHYTVAWICALPLEAAAATAMFEKTHPKLLQPVADENAYTLGEIAGHNIVIACLPSGVCGTTSAATVVIQIRFTFPSIRFGLMVGIGGGVPGTKIDIRLGDIVVSTPTGVLGGVVQYDYGKTVASGIFQQTGMMNQPPQVLLNAISLLQADKILGINRGIMEIASDVLNRHVEMKRQFSRPAPEEDHLYDAAYHHYKYEDTCVKCDNERLIHRKIRDSDEPQVHYGLVASGNQIMKDGQTRDRLAKEHGMLCFEMEAAGLMNQLPCLVIRGICDYCDSHKNKRWQGYAALTAAVYSKILLSVVPVSQLWKDRIPPTGYWMVPFKRNTRFLGRQNEILKLEKMILSKDQTRKAAIAGLGGVGKTQIALELAYRVHDSDPKCSIFWIPATSVEATEQAFMNMGERLGLQDATPTDMKSQVKALLSSERVGSWLLVIDNADDIDIWMSSDNLSPPLKAFLPQNPHGFTLFTTRNQQLASKLVGPDIVSVSEMDDTTAKHLLERSLARKELLEDGNSATRLICQLSGLPLALIQAASYINTNLISLKTYLSLLSEQERGIVELLSQDFEDEWRYDEMKNPVAVTWLISFDQIQRSNALAANYLSFMSSIDPRDIPQSLLPPAGSRTQQQNALGLLRAYAFITRQADDRFISLHRLVHLATRNWLRNEGLLDKYAAMAGKRLIEVFPSDEHKNRMLWREYLSHGQFILESREFQDETEARELLAQKVGKCLNSDGRYHEAEVLFKEILEKRRERYKDNDPQTLISMSNLAFTYQNEGRWTEAEKLEVQVIETRNKFLGPEHPDTLVSMSNLASTYLNQGRWTEAEKLQVQVIETMKKVLGPEHPNMLASMANLAFTYRNQGRWTEAEKLQVQVIETRKKVLGPEHPDTLASMSNLALTYCDQGRWTKAEKLYVEVIETKKKVLGPEHPDTMASMSNLALTYSNQERWMEAEKLEVQAIETMRRVLGPEHPDTLASMSNLALTYWNQGQWTEAEKLQVQVIETRQNVLGPEHPDTMACMSNLALTYSNQGRWMEAEKLEVQIIEIRKATLGPEHPDTLVSMSNLASTYWNQGRWMEAEKLYVQVIEIKKNVLGHEHPDTLASIGSLASTYSNQGRWMEAEKLQVQVMETMKTILGPQHPLTLTNMWNLSHTWKKQGRNDAAIELLSTCVQLRSQILGPTHPHTRSAADDLENWRKQQRNRKRDVFTKLFRRN